MFGSISGALAQSGSDGGSGSSLSGSGTVNTIPMFTGSYTISNSNIVQSNGNIGIGTASPQAQLHVLEPASENLDWIGILNNPNNSGSGYGVGLRLQNSTIGSGGNEPNKWAGIAAIASSAFSNNTDLVFYTGNFNSATNTTFPPSERLRIQSTTGNVGINTTTPSSALEVNGNLTLTQGSGAAIIFPDGSTQSTAFNNSGSETINAGQVIFPDGSSLTSAVGLGIPAGAVLNKTVSNGQGGGIHTYLIATLIPDNDGDGDHLNLVATMNFGDGSASNTTLDLLFGNRGGFNAIYDAKGASPTGFPVDIVAYRQSDATTNIYVVLPDYWDSVTYSVIDNMQDVVYASPADSGPTTPPGTLVFDTSSSSYPPDNYASFGGRSGINTGTPTAQLEVNGNMKITAGSGGSITFADGSVQSTAYTGACSTGGDYAESVDVSGNRSSYEPGDVLVLSPDSRSDVSKSSGVYSTMVAGIYSTKPGYVGRRQTTDPRTATSEVPMAMVGIVPTKVSAENGPIRRGDLLVTASLSGYAMKGTDPNRMLGAVIGKAMGSLESGRGVIQVLVSLQ